MFDDHSRYPGFPYVFVMEGGVEVSAGLQFKVEGGVVAALFLRLFFRSIASTKVVHWHETCGTAPVVGCY